MIDINLPATKEILWHKMRGDLKSLVPWFDDTDRLLCPVCCRPLSYEDFSLEHIIPRQAIAEDPADAKKDIPNNERSGITLLCRKKLIFNNGKTYNNGCNSWKGKFFDPFLREALRSNILNRRFDARHHVALFSAAYLGLFRKFGYQVALLPSGLIMRNQFFRPEKFIKEMPICSQIVLTNDSVIDYTLDTQDHWREPFKISISKDVALVSLRKLIIPLPISRDPSVPLARALAYAPSRYVFRPDLRTFFE